MFNFLKKKRKNYSFFKFFKNLLKKKSKNITEEIKINFYEEI